MQCRWLVFATPVFHGWRRRGGKPLSHQAGVCLWSKLQKQRQLLPHSCPDTHGHLQGRQVKILPTQSERLTAIYWFNWWFALRPHSTGHSERAELDASAGESLHGEQPGGPVAAVAGLWECHGCHALLPRWFTFAVCTMNVFQASWVSAMRNLSKCWKDVTSHNNSLQDLCFSFIIYFILVL